MGRGHVDCRPKTVGWKPQIRDGSDLMGDGLAVGPSVAGYRGSKGR